jgi:hypothetical protein
VLIAARITRAKISDALVSVYINNFGEYHHPYEKLRNNPRRFFGYFRGEIKTFDHILNLISEKTQKKWGKCHGNPTGREEHLLFALRYFQIIIVPVCSNMLQSRLQLFYCYFI